MDLSSLVRMNFGIGPNEGGDIGLGTLFGLPTQNRMGGQNRNAMLGATSGDDDDRRRRILSLLLSQGYSANEILEMMGDPPQAWNERIPTPKGPFDNLRRRGDHAD